ncbi:uncharacterized protein V1516DRAFT_616588, partial [Lipomyces oligophaga]|uniref:uncharacterized protein n=1 Tax=Lipomyces oligophaga TaxID=45792 RepID=UPI0034CE30EA
NTSKSTEIATPQPNFKRGRGRPRGSLTKQVVEKRIGEELEERPQEEEIYASGRPKRKVSGKLQNYASAIDTDPRSDLESGTEEVLSSAALESGILANEGRRRRGRPPKDQTNGSKPRPPKRIKSNMTPDNSEDEFNLSDRNSQEEEDDDNFEETNEIADTESDLDQETEQDAFQDSKPTQRALKSKMKLKSNGQSEKGKLSGIIESTLTTFYGSQTSELVRAVDVRNRWVNYPGNLLISNCENAKFPEFKGWLDTHLQVLKQVDVDNSTPELPNGEPIDIEIGPANSLDRKLIGKFETINTTTKSRQSHIINVGGYPASCEWAPLTDSETQYLAVAVMTNSEEISMPIFQPRPSPSVIQIWSSNLDSTDEPKLVTCLLHKWGTPTNLKWSPVEKGRTEAVIGTLGAVFNDGTVKLVEVPRSMGSKTEYFRVEAPARVLSLPGMGIHSLAWIDSGQIAVGSTTGFIAVFDLLDGLQEEDSETSLLTSPKFCEPVHESVVIAMTSCGPDLPYFIASTSMDGYTRAIDVRDARLCRSSKSREQWFSPSISFNVHLRAITMACDIVGTEACGVLSMTGSVAMSRHEGSVSVTSSSLCHGFSASGAADGSVVLVNIVGKSFTPPKSRSKGWPQIETIKLELSSTCDGKRPRYRIMDRFKVNTESAKRAKASSVIIYPASVCVTSISWNSKKSFAGWYAACFANGLVKLDNF